MCFDLQSADRDGVPRGVVQLGPGLYRRQTLLDTVKAVVKEPTASDLRSSQILSSVDRRSVNRRSGSTFCFRLQGSNIPRITECLTLADRTRELLPPLFSPHFKILSAAINLLATDFFFQILAHPVFKM